MNENENENIIGFINFIFLYIYKIIIKNENKLTAFNFVYLNCVLEHFFYSMIFA